MPAGIKATHTHSRARLAQFAQAGVQEAFFIDGDPKTMAERLDTLLGLHGWANKGVALVAEAMVMADRLLKVRQTTKKATRTFFHALI